MGTRRILVVEDSKSVGSLLRDKLQAAHFDVVWGTSMAEATALLDGGDDFCGAILDFRLPDAPEGEIIDLVVGHGIPSVVFTGNLSNDVREKVWEKQVVDYVLKDNPAAPDYLTSTLLRLERNAATKALVVEDSPSFRMVIASLLRIHRFQVLTATNGREALRVLADHPDIKLVVTDYSMPEMDGFQLTQMIRRQHPREELVIIGISARGDRIMPAHFIKYGANDFIIKQTFLTEEFYSRVNQCLDNLENIHRIREAAVTDYLTGLRNRRYFFDFGNTLFASVARRNITLTCAMVDIDFFKKVNDTYGHGVGDLVLRHVATILRERMRTTDVVARIGGEEFCILAVNVKPGTEEALFDGLRQRLAESPLAVGGGHRIGVTVSIGVAGSDNVFSLEEMVKTADERLYAAKKGGRNRVVVGGQEV